MRTILSRAIRIGGLLTLIMLSLAAGGAGWAEQREARLLRGPMSLPAERPTAVTCNLAQTTECNGVAQRACSATCSNPNQGAGNCNNCKEEETQRCLAVCR